MKKLFIFLMVMSFNLVSCVSTQVTKLVPKVDYPPVHPEKVQVFLSEKDIIFPYEKLAIIHMQGSANWTNEAQMIKAAKKKAAEIGANAIILSQIKEPGAGAKVAGALFGVYVDRRGEVIAIRIFEDATVKPIIQKTSNVHPVEFELDIELAPDSTTTKLPNFRLAVPKAKNFSDEKILELYRRKYPKLKNKSDNELIEIIEKTYAKKLKSKK